MFQTKELADFIQFTRSIPMRSDKKIWCLKGSMERGKKICTVIHGTRVKLISRKKALNYYLGLLTNSWIEKNISQFIFKRLGSKFSSALSSITAEIGTSLLIILFLSPLSPIQ